MNTDNIYFAILKLSRAVDMLRRHAKTSDDYNEIDSLELAARRAQKELEKLKQGPRY